MHAPPIGRHANSFVRIQGHNPLTLCDVIKPTVVNIVNMLFKESRLLIIVHNRQQARLLAQPS